MYGVWNKNFQNIYKIPQLNYIVIEVIDRIDEQLYIKTASIQWEKYRYYLKIYIYYFNINTVFLRLNFTIILLLFTFQTFCLFVHIFCLASVLWDIFFTVKNIKWKWKRKIFYILLIQTKIIYAVNRLSRYFYKK